MEIVKLKIDALIFQDLIKSGHLNINDVDVQQIEPNDFDYSFSTKWQEAKKASLKAFKKLKEIEYKLRH